jgi:adenylate kinase
LRVALTGTPGVGKSTVAREASRDGWRVVDVKAWAAECGCVTGRDADGTLHIDTDALARHVPKDDGSRALYEGHLSHHLPVEQAWVLRLDPDALGRRLRSRGYRPAKVRENLEAEALDLILQEALDRVGRTGRVIQRDATSRTPAELYRSLAAASGAAPSAGDVEPVDWTSRLPIGGA